MSELHPIETAPDGKLVLVISLDGNGEIAWAEAAKRGSGPLRSCWYTRYGSFVSQPSHWTYLPEVNHE